jgi:penicillin-binding protein 1C
LIVSGIATAAILLLLDVLFPLPLDRLTPPSSTVFTDRHGSLLRVTLAADDMWRIPIRAEDVPDHLKRSVIGYEDQYFRWHPGVNPVSIGRAAVANVRAGEIVQGGSTITMQLARMMEPRPRTFRSKIIEAWRALQLEARYSKDEILAHYLNLAPYGGNIVGVGAAGRFYFDKYADQLSPGEAALLAAIPRAPNQLRPDSRPNDARAARQHVVELLRKRGVVSLKTATESINEPLPKRQTGQTFEAPHLTTFLSTGEDSRLRVKTTLDLGIQRTVERILEMHIGPLQSRGITNGAVVVLDVASRDVLALVGSLDFGDNSSSGQVNGAMSPRSPGSALKPFIYALGIEHGLVDPRTLLEDVPVDYAGYRPVNFDRTYHGVVAVEDALVRSLNVPAVNLYARLGSRGLYGFLREAGVSTLPEEKEYYGLSLVLGGAEVTLIELTNLFAGLADRGSFRPARLTDTDPPTEGTRLLSVGTAYILTDMLTRLRRPDLPSSWEWSVDAPRIAWKTGTSYGHRDAWSIGYSPRHAVGVWVGNFDGRGAPDLVGVEVAAPVLIDIFQVLEGDDRPQWFAQPDEVSTRRVCSLSGKRPTRACVSTLEELFVPGISPEEDCDIHRTVEIASRSGYRVCRHCRSGRSTHAESREFWPRGVAVWLEEQGYPVDHVPPHDPTCSSVVSGAPPLIVSPSDGAEYLLSENIGSDYQKILLEARASNATERIFWFLNGQMIYSGSPVDRHFVRPEPGLHKLVVTDDEGRSSEVAFSVLSSS